MDARRFMTCAQKHPAATRRCSSAFGEGKCSACNQSQAAWKCVQCELGACDMCIDGWIFNTTPTRPQSTFAPSVFETRQYSSSAFQNAIANVSPAPHWPFPSAPSPPSNPFDVVRRQPSKQYTHSYDYDRPDMAIDREESSGNETQMI